jgi:nitrate/nitrite-specific signal transduction histidine kinase
MRRARTYLLDPRFQLKWTGLLVGSVLAVTIALGVVIAKTADEAAFNAELASTQAEKALKESATSAKLLHMFAETYQDVDPELAKTLDKDDDEIERQYQRDLDDLVQRRGQVDQQKKKIIRLMIGGATAVSLILALLGIFITHRVVGPAFRMKRLLRQVGTSRFDVDVVPLRRGDELGDLFETFVQMTFSLRAMQAGRLATLDATIAKANAANVPEDVLRRLSALRAQLTLGLQPDSHRPQQRSV